MIAYNPDLLTNLEILKHAKGWKNKNIIDDAQWQEISARYKVGIYHPNYFIRLSLFLATLTAIGAVFGLVTLFMSAVDLSSDAVAWLLLFFGGATIVALDRIFVKQMFHFKSGVTEGLLYTGILSIVIGAGLLSEFRDEYFTAFVLLAITATAAIRYLDLISTTLAMGTLMWILFHSLSEWEGMGAQLLPFAGMVLSMIGWSVVRRYKHRATLEAEVDCFNLSEGLWLLTFYASGNYLVVRELSVALLGMQLNTDSDIPLAWLFYAFTVIVPLSFIYAGVRLRNRIMLWAGLFVLGFSAFTFKYYYSLGHHEITLTAGGIVLILAAWIAMRYLREPRNGFTRESVLDESLGNAHLQAFVIAQTLPTKPSETPEGGISGGGGSFGGGGSSGSF